MIEKHPGVRLALHYSGPLLLWFEKKTHRNISTVAKKNWWPPAVWTDRRRILRAILISFYRGSGRALNRCGVTSRAFWPAARSVAGRASLGAQLPGRWRRRIGVHAGGRFAVHRRGFEAEELFGTYIAEDRGKSVWCVSRLKDFAI